MPTDQGTILPTIEQLTKLGTGVCRLLRLDQHQVKIAMGVAASTPAGLVQNFRTYTKSLHAGMAARNAVMAAQLTGDGLAANPSFLEGAGGMLAVYGRGDTERLRTMVDGLGAKWREAGRPHAEALPMLWQHARRDQRHSGPARPGAGVTRPDRVCRGQ